VNTHPVSFEELADWLEVPLDQLRSVEPRYHTFEIPKRAGGTRTIHAPDDRLKALQGAILHRVLSGLRAHPAAHGFERGRSIVTNARPHVGKAVAVSLDLRDFFPSTEARRVRRYFRAIGWSRIASGMLSDLCTYEGGLPQGAPTSPRLSNLINYRMDARLAGLAHSLGADYTRYADDITFSLVRDASAAAIGPISTTRRIVGDFGYRMHPDKLSVRRRHQRQEVTGLVVNETIALPRETRRWLRAVEHRLRTAGECTLAEDELQGWLGLVNMVHQQGAGAGIPGD
jgi:retron-type reverse transcriptase